jgi:hypothetical protein
MLKNNATENVHSISKNETFQMPCCGDVACKNMLTVKVEYSFILLCIIVIGTGAVDTIIKRADYYYYYLGTR